MEHDQGRSGGASPQAADGDWRLAVSSRRRALARLLAAVENGPVGPVLMTGEPGAGKSWQARQLATLLPDQWRTVFVDLATAMNAFDFLRLIGHGLGVAVSDGSGAARSIVQGLLEDEARDGRRWLLVVDEAQRASASVWEEILSLINLLGRPSGFAAILVLGHTELARALSTRRYGQFESRLSLHLHLMPLDFDEACDLLGCSVQPGGALERALEELHRDARGNPARLFRLARVRPAVLQPDADREKRRQIHAQKRLPSAPLTSIERAARPDDADPSLDPAQAETRPASAHPAGLPLIPTKPPIRDEDGLVEVGWEGDLESDLDSGGESAGHSQSLADDQSLNEELIEDRYAALQAWAEWTRNQGRSARANPGDEAVLPGHLTPMAAGQDAKSGHIPADPIEPASHEDSPAFAGSKDPTGPEDAVDPVADDGRGPASPPAGIRAEGQHDFAPYSHLFTRLRAKG
jgi:general secretion pathway protein A